MTTTSSRPRSLVLAVLCLCVIAIYMDAMIVNLALPSLVRELGSSTTGLQWIIDAYALTFAALVLAAGSLGDRFGRRNTLLLGLVIFTVATGLGALCTSTGQLIAARTVMGLGAALIFPSTLSILTNVFVERTERAAAIGVWGAVSGIGVVLGPIVGGLLLEYFWWGSVFVVVVPVGLVCLVLTVLVVPDSRDPATPGLDVPGLVLSTAGIGVLVYSIIEAPNRGWLAAPTLLGFAGAAALLALLVARELRTPHPMIDMRLFANLRFSAACATITITFFTLNGFTFLVTQYFQFLKDYTPLGAGVRLIPVAVAIVVGSVLGGKLVLKVGTRAVVTTGLVLMALAYAWFSVDGVDTSYSLIAAQMVLIGLGIGSVAVPATESIMAVVPADKAGIGSAMNDATRLFGGTLGIAVVGSVHHSLYTGELPDSLPGLPADLLDHSRDSVGAALGVAARVAESGGQGVAAALVDSAEHAFLHGFQISCLVVTGICAVAAVVAGSLLPTRAPIPDAEPAPADSESRQTPEGMSS
ncbi:MFS transporter [Nocardia farcinica]|uniref:MFS transporter n=1 Tax=Nocardia farcinica TaxID=37329 RepID=UPI001893BB63|nr:MFS transporter [Nocardia farcinica]MBF6231666.1 MFS transporter [Nocardia farcinica]